MYFKPSGAEDMEQRTDLGLVKGHAYGITNVKKVDLNDTKLFKKIFKWVYDHYMESAKKIIII